MQIDTKFTAPPISEVRKRVDKKDKKEKKEKREKKEKTSDSEDHSGHDHATPSAPQSALSKTIRFLLLASLIPAMYFVPYVLRFAGAQVKTNFHLLIYLWILYASMYPQLSTVRQ